ncbi:hypothetical protein KDK95_30000 [Actinospica sp. MGRD01-02]|uniref:Uncharacterized protein n=1 Tax=Actinospica acidithermotolerans TaxID=2828514 RepID=A0A941EHF8_9ACTN|nr:hypothetical protein [Actinospica acidithermotolerans]MBR7830572.1 hypothetical protein [Actinospica acidithermotolerans]
MIALQTHRVVSERDPEEEFRPYFAVWCGTGPGRLHRTIATGEVISKAECAHYTAELFPAYEELLKRVRASRLGDASVKFTMNDGRLLGDLVEEVCDSAKKLP